MKVLSKIKERRLVVLIDLSALSSMNEYKGLLTVLLAHLNVASNTMEWRYTAVGWEHSSETNQEVPSNRNLLLYTRIDR